VDLLSVTTRERLFHHLNGHFSHLADALIQSDLQEQLGLSALLKGTAVEFSPSLLGDSNQQPFGYWPNRQATSTNSTVYLFAFLLKRSVVPLSMTNVITITITITVRIQFPADTSTVYPSPKTSTVLCNLKLSWML
jgi:hypothetical protein